MERNKVHIFFAYSDRKRIASLRRRLNDLGLEAGSNENQLLPEWDRPADPADIIKNCRALIFFFSENAVKSRFLMQEMQAAIEYAIERGKLIITIVENKDVLDNSDTLKYTLGRMPVFIPKDGLQSESDYDDIAAMIYDVVVGSETKELLYEKITSLSRIRYTPGVSKNLCALLRLLCKEVKRDFSLKSRRDTYKEILRSTEQLEQCDEHDYSDESIRLAHMRVDAIDEVESLIGSFDFLQLDLYLISLALKLNYLTYTIRKDAADTLSHGDVHGLGNLTAEKYVPAQEFFLRLYYSQMISEGISEKDHGQYPDDEISLILNLKSFLIKDRASSVFQPSKPEKKTAPVGEISDLDKQLYAIADYMRESNKLFELAGNSSLAADFLRCLKTSYDRLRKYSEIVGCMEVCAECIEHIAEINQMLEGIDGGSSGSDIVENGFKALLGFSIEGVDDFDVFLSYDHEDGDIASGVYHFLKTNLINPFYDKITLPELSKSEYEDAIMNAIDHSRHFAVILSDLKYLESHWVDLEMKTFRHEMVEGRKENANFLIIVTDAVYQQIISQNKQCLPIKYRSYEIMKISEYKNTLTDYLK